MKHFFLILLSFCLLPAVVPAQLIKKTYTQEEILKDKDYIALQAQMKPVEEKMNAIRKEYEQATSAKKNDPSYQTAIQNRYSSAVKEVTTILQSFITKNPNSYISLMALGELMQADGIEVATLTNLYKGLSESVKRTDFGEELGAQLLSESLTAIGVVAPDFTQNDPNGKPVKLSDFRGKYVLIDFWASWCGPCRKENPTVVKAYAQFKNKNFEILGVSLDNPNAKAAWLKAIETDKLTWTQVSDLQGWNNKVAVLYGVKGIPQNFLLDPKGVIIAKNLRGDELIQTLSTALK